MGRDRSKTATLAASPLIDTGALARLLDDLGPELVLETSALFLVNARQSANAIRAALVAQDAAAVAREAHRLKSSCGFLGASALVSLSSEMERLGDAGDLDTVRTRVDLLPVQVEQTGRELDAAIADLTRRGHDPGGPAT